jgi:hypothetical protein
MLLFTTVALAAPLFSGERGLYDAPFDLEILPTNGGTVSYSLSDADPTIPYAGPIAIDGTTIVRAREVAADGTSSETITHTYLFVDQILTSPLLDPVTVNDPVRGPVLEASLRSLPTLSVVVPGGVTLIEQEGSFEFIDPFGESVQVNGGVHIVGGTSYVNEKASIRLNFRSEYGAPRFQFDLYGPDATGVAASESHDALSLRSGNHDTVFYLGARAQLVRNLFMDETQLAMGHVAPHGRFGHLYLNGAPHGLYHVRERWGAGFMASYFGGPEEQYETINGGNTEDGDGRAWAAAVAAAGDYEALQEWIHVPNYLDYMVLQYYAGNAWDWYSWHNWMSAGPSEPGRGGFIFHSNDSDICLDYEWDVNILYLGGPSDIFPALLAEGHPDFQVALADAIHRNLEADGPLTAANAAGRYADLAAGVEDAILAEEARWSFGWWRRDEEWVTERDDLLVNWFPRRTDELLRQMIAEGWYPVPAPELTVAGDVLTVSPRAGFEDAELWVTVDGTDPRLPGGEPAPTAALVGAPYDVAIDRTTEVRARLRRGDVWGAVAIERVEVDEDPPLILNEWNAVEPDEVLADGDSALGVVAGNGGDWIELVVVEDGLDLRGWRLSMEDRWGPLPEIRFTDDPLLASLRVGTIVTVAEELAEDAGYDPEVGDWRFHLQAADGASGRYVVAADFDVTPLDWKLTVWDGDGHVRFGPVGESVAPAEGIAGHEVGRLEADPSGAIRGASEDYEDGDGSTYGAPNAWGDEVQVFDWLRGATDDPWTPGDAPTEPSATAPEPSDDEGPEATGCGCASAGGAGPWWLGALALVSLRRRMAVAVAFSGCAAEGPEPATGRTGTATTAPVADTAPPAAEDADGDGFPVGEDCDDHDDDVYPGAPERCDGVDSDCDDVVDDADDVVDGLPFYEDLDGDGYGTGVVTACAIGTGAAVYGGDCDDADVEVYPGAVELCDTIDQDCDGNADDALGATEECPAVDCLEVLGSVGLGADGPYWVALGGAAPVLTWCDLTTDGGGWTLGFLRNTASTISQGGFGGVATWPEVLDVWPGDASASSTPRLGWHDLESFGWTELVVAAYAWGGPTYRSRTIPRTELRIPFGSDGYLLYGGASGYYWCGGDKSFTDLGQGAVNNPAGAPPDCKGHTWLGSGWDFSESTTPDGGLTLCGADGSKWMYAGWVVNQISYGTVGGAQAIWVR